MPLIKGKSEKSFKENVSTEMHHGKPLKQSLAIAYATKRRAEHAKKMAHGGKVKGVHQPHMPMPIYDEDERNKGGQSLAGYDVESGEMGSAKAEHHRILAEMKSMKKPHGEFSDGGSVDPFQKAGTTIASGVSPETAKQVASAFGPRAQKKASGGMIEDPSKMTGHSGMVRSRSETGHEKGVHIKGHMGRSAGISQAGQQIREISYGGKPPGSPKSEHERVLGEMKSMKKPHGEFSDGGSVDPFQKAGTTIASGVSPETAKQVASAFGPRTQKKSEGGVIAADEDRMRVKGVHQQAIKNTSGGRGGVSTAGYHERNLGAYGHAVSKKMHRENLEELKSMKKPELYAEGGYLNGDEDESAPTAIAHEEESGFLPMPKDGELHNHAAMLEDEKELNQHGAMEHGPMGSEGGFHSMVYPGGDIVARIMAKQLNERGKPEHEAVSHFSLGGRVANATPLTAGFKPNEFDDLVLRDHLESTYGEDDNAGDSLGDAREDHDRHDIVARIMKKHGKQHLPRPA